MSLALFKASNLGHLKNELQNKGRAGWLVIRITISILRGFVGLLFKKPMEGLEKDEDDTNAHSMVSVIFGRN